MRDPIKLPDNAYSSIVLGDRLVIGGWEYINIYSLPSLQLLTHINMDFDVDKLVALDERFILCGGDNGHINILSVEDYTILAKYEHDGRYITDMI